MDPIAIDFIANPTPLGPNVLRAAARLHRAAIALVKAEEDHTAADRDDNIADAEIDLEDAMIGAGFMSAGDAIESIAIDVIGDRQRSIVVMFEYGVPVTLKTGV